MPTPINNNIIDLDLGIQKKKFRFGNDDNRIVELNTSDVGLVSRLSEALPKLNDLQIKASKIGEGISKDTDDLEAIKILGDNLKSIDTEMRSLVDFIFGAEVSKAAAPDGSMYDPLNGQFRFERIIAVIMTQYAEDYQAEFNKINNQIQKHAGKYVKKKG